MPAFHALNLRLESVRATIAAIATATVLLVGCSDDGGSPSITSTIPSPQPEIESLVQTGLDQLASGQDEAAVTSFEDVLAVDPENLYALYNLGQIAQGRGEKEEALSYYDKALTVQADYTPALFNKAILLETTVLERAVQLYRRVLEIDEEMAAAHMRLGFALLHLGRTAEAERHLGRGLELDPAMSQVEAPRYE